MVVHLHTGAIVQYQLEEVDSVTFTLQEDLHDVVDMGLSVRWATCNVGASKPEEYGAFFAWGETSEKTSYTEENYKHYANYQYEDIGSDINGTSYDVAHQVWGGDWRMPTREEIHELTTKCTWAPETVNRVKGFRVYASNGNSIFLPAAGCMNGTKRQEEGEGGFYWSSSVNTSMPSSAYNLNFRGYDSEWTASRAYGFSVRPVKKVESQ